MANVLRRFFEAVRPRMLPSLVVIGAQKAGTSALFAMLSKHPLIAAPKTKEIDFFNDDKAYGQGLRYYRSFFPAIPLRKRGYITVEASPSYLYFAAKAAPRIAKDLPRANCLAILRDPVKRAYSAWNMYRDFKGDPKYGHLHDPRSFTQAVEDELAGRTQLPAHRYLARGLYAGQIAQFKTSLPDQNLLVRSYLSLKNNPDAFVNDICMHIGVPPLPKGQSISHVRANSRSYPEKLDPGLAKELYQYYSAELDQLRNVLGYELDILEYHG